MSEQLSDIPDFYEKNRAALERQFNHFSQNATLIQTLAGGDTEEQELEVIVVHRNPVSLDNYTNFDVQIKALQRDLPSDFAQNDYIRLSRNDQLFQVDAISDEVVTVRLECSAQTTIS